MKRRVGKRWQGLALISGAGTRVGAALAKGLGEAGAELALHCKDSVEGAQALAKALQSAGAKAKVFVADFEEEGAAERLAQEICAQMGPPNLLLHNAALMQGEIFEETSAQSLERMWKINVRAPFLLSQQLVGPMREAGGGNIIHMLDIAGVSQTWSRYAAYAMTKAALAALCRSLAKALAPDIRVNGIAPGLILPGPEMSAAEEAALVSKIPMKEKVSSEALLGALFFLLSNPSMTGHILTLDGGRSL